MAIKVSGTTVIDDSRNILNVGSFVSTQFKESVGSITGSTLDLSTGNVFSYTPAADTTFVFSNPPASGTAQGFTLKVTGADVLSGGFDLANAVYDSVSFSVVAQEVVPQDLFFKTDGLKMYVSGSTGDDVDEYDLSTAWDISTASFVQSFSVAAQASGTTGLSFKPDGLKMYVSDQTTDTIYQYSLSTAWDISTASYDSVSFLVTADTSPVRFTFNDSGDKVYVVGQQLDNLYQYSLSVPWDISSASYDSVSFSLAGQDTSPQDVFFNPNGTKMYYVGSATDTVYEYALSSAFDISTASYNSVSFSVATQDSVPLGLFFKSDGSKMYILGTGNDTIYQYTTGSSTPATLTYPTSVDWPAGTAPDAPADGETDVLVFYTEDGGTTYYGFQAGDAMA